MTRPIPSAGPSATPAGGPAPSLTSRELELLRRVADGTTYVELAREWVLAEVSVRTAGLRVIRKLGARNITHAVHLAHLTGVLEAPEQRRHGDHPGYAAHIRRGETPCEACKAGESAYRAERRRVRSATKARQRDAA